MAIVRTTLRLHNILGLVIGAQFLFWVASGFFFTLYPIEQIRGNHFRTELPAISVPLEDVSIMPTQLSDLVGSEVVEATLTTLIDKPVWRVRSESGVIALIDAETGALVSPIAQTVAEQVYERGIKSDIGIVTSVFRLEADPPREYGGPLPAWVFEHDRGRNRIYIDATTGDIRSIRTENWRVFDVLWRFHIMDITGDDRFDSWWLKLFAFLGLAMVLTGLVLVVRRIVTGRLFH